MILVLFSFFLVFTAGLKGIQTFTPVLLVDTLYPESVGNSALMLFFAAAAGGILVGSYLADRYDPRSLLIVSLSVGAAVVWLERWFSTAWPPLVALGTFVAAGAFLGIIYPSRDRLVAEYAADGAAGKSFGSVFTGTTVGGLISPPLLGYVIDLTAPSVAFLLVGIAFALAGGIVVLLSLEWADIRTRVVSRSD